MGLFRKNETYNEQMLREAGLDRVRFREPQPDTEPDPQRPQLDRRPVGPGNRMPLSVWNVIPPVQTGPMAWDAMATAVAPGIAGDSVRFTVLPDGDLIVEEEEGDGDLSPLADAVESRISPPYKVDAARQEGDLWGIGAKAIRVETFAFPGADSLVLSQTGGAAELRVDGEPSDAAPPAELQRLGEQEGTDFCVEADRIDGDYWEVRVSAL